MLSLIAWVDESRSPQAIRALFDEVSEPTADVVFILTSSLHRLAAKYGPFGYRLAHLDAGVAAGQIFVASSALGFDCRIAPITSDPRVSRALGLRPPEEIMTAVLTIHPGDDPERRDAVRSRVAVTGCGLATARPYEDFFEASPTNVVAMLLDDGQLDAPSYSGPWDVDPPSLAVNTATAEPCFTFDDGPVRSLGLRTVLEQRASVRTFQPLPMSVTDLAAMLRAAVQWDGVDRLARNLTFTICARNVSGLAPGVYHYVPQHHRLIPRRGPLSDAEAATLFVQADLAAAPVQIWVGGNLAAVCAVDGTRGYRNLLVRAGLSVQRISFAALATGNAGTVVAGVVGEAAKAACGFNGLDNAAIVAFVCGRPPSSSGGDVGKNAGTNV